MDNSQELKNSIDKNKKSKVWFFTPYSFEGKLFEAYDQYMSLLQNQNDWVVFMDGDALFFHSNFGHLIQEYIEKYPNTGMFTCYTNRIGTRTQIYDRELFDVDSVKYNFLKADFLLKDKPLESTVLNTPISGFLMVIKRATWKKINKELKQSLKSNQLLHVDYAISNILIEKKYTIRRMDSILVFHYYRFVEGNASNRGLI